MIGYTKAFDSNRALLLAVALLVGLGLVAEEAVLASTQGGADPSDVSLPQPEGGDRVAASRVESCSDRTAEERYERTAQDSRGLDWTAREEHQADLPAFEAVLASYEASILGSFADHENQRLVVVLSEDVPPRVEERLVRDMRSSTKHLSVLVRPGCTSRDRLDAAMDSIIEEAGDDGALTATVDAATSTIIVRIDAGQGALRQQLASHDRDVVRVHEAPPGDTVSRAIGGRFADRDPYWGGSRIVFPPDAQGRREACSTSFAVNRAGIRWHVTTGHCHAIENAQVVNGAGDYYGTYRHRRFPNPDLALVGSSNRTYSRTIYTGSPDTVASRNVTAKRPRVAATTFICVSGQRSLFNCGNNWGPIQVVNPSTTLCDGGCTRDLYTAVGVNDAIVVRPGDSGGPALGRRGTRDAEARGVVVGRTRGGTIGYFHHIATVESSLGPVACGGC